MSEMWSRGTGQGIGLSGHKNTYSGQATLIDNWTEELYGVQLAANWDVRGRAHGARGCARARVAARSPRDGGARAASAPRSRSTSRTTRPSRPSTSRRRSSRSSAGTRPPPA